MNLPVLLDSLSGETLDGFLTIGKTRIKLFEPQSALKIPKVLFYENLQHLQIIEVFNVLLSYIVLSFILLLVLLCCHIIVIIFHIFVFRTVSSEFYLIIHSK